jgi:hypothetical protein
MHEGLRWENNRMTLLFVKELTGTKVLNLDNVTAIEFEGAGSPSLDFWVGPHVYRFQLKAGTKESQVLDRLCVALAPAFEGRLAQVAGVKAELDLTSLQSDTVKF